VRDMAKTRAWILRISAMNAWSVTIVAGLFALGSLVVWDTVGIVVGLAVTGAGAMELHGRQRLVAGRAGAQDWMAGSQLWLLICVLAYAAWRLLVFDWAAPLSSMSVEELRQLGVLTGLYGDTLAQFVSMLYGLIYVVVAIVTLVYQGGLGLYYWRRVGVLEGISSSEG